MIRFDIVERTVQGEKPPVEVEYLLTPFGRRFLRIIDEVRRLEEAVNQEARDPASAEAVVREFWRLMATNDFASVKAVLADEFVLEWPQSKERIRGGDNFARMNTEYPAHGRWRFRINRLIASGDVVVTQVSVTDGTQSAEPISFFTVVDGKITQLTEFWPEPYAAPQNRRHLTEPME